MPRIFFQTKRIIQDPHSSGVEGKTLTLEKKSKGKQRGFLSVLEVAQERLWERAGDVEFRVKRSSTVLPLAAKKKERGRTL